MWARCKERSPSYPSYPLALHLTSQVLFSELREWQVVSNLDLLRSAIGSTRLRVCTVKLGGSSVPLHPPSYTSAPPWPAVPCCPRLCGLLEERCGVLALLAYRTHPKASCKMFHSASMRFLSSTRVLFMTPKSAHCAPLKGPRCELWGKEQLTAVKWSNSGWRCRWWWMHTHAEHCGRVGTRRLVAGCVESCAGDDERREGESRPVQSSAGRKSSSGVRLLLWEGAFV